MGTFLDQIVNSIGGLQKLNSITKYPSILTYHNLGPKGTLVDSLVEDRRFENGDIFVTEKVDGTNSRIVFFTNDKGVVEDYIIGSREDFLFARNDRVINPALGIVNTVKETADIVTLFSDANEKTLAPNSMYCLYGETYGGKVNGFKQYTSQGIFGVRFFDMFALSYEQLEDLFQLSLDGISTWRKQNGQPFVSVNTFASFCHDFHLERVPPLRKISASELPTSLQETWDWMQKFAKSSACLDGGGLGNSEGVVIRTRDRSLIRKLRFEEYQKTERMGLMK